MYVAALIAAGGRGRRFGGDRPKQLLSVGGRPILERSVAAFLTHPAVSEVIVSLPQELVDQPPAYLQSAAKSLRIVVGGIRRQDSVANSFRVSRVVPPMVLPPAPVMTTPALRLPSAVEPVTSIPIALPCTRLPVAPEPETRDVARAAADACFRGVVAAASAAP